jgi:hypothetical protein
MSEEDRDAGNRKLKLLFVAIVTASAGLITLQADATPVETAAALGAGFLVSLPLTWYLSRTLAEFGNRPRKR